ncbi:MAG: hypothetical protein HKM04_03725 [Legionellales bacterium]|nr:hypothetical protein [Legionellales bacterium]
MSTRDWEKLGGKIIRIELEKRDMNYIDLHQALANIGINESLPSMRNKFARGNFSVTFFIQCLVAMGVDVLQLSTYDLSLQAILTNMTKQSLKDGE